jgi:MurNAc alpha-1-phosphate uridylyltransferase
MVMAAGLGTRMRPLSNDKPKALVEVAGRALIDHTLDRLVEAGVETAVVNVHAFADQMRAHLAHRATPRILISDESDRLLETGGGLKKARALLGEAPIFVANSDYVWTGEGEPLPRQLARAFDPARMDALVTVVPKDRTLGFDTPGDFFVAADGALTRRGDAPEAPYHAFGIQIIDPGFVYAAPEEAFSLRGIWFAMAERGRLFGLVPPGLWMQVGDPEAVSVAEAALAAAPAA